MNKERRVKKEEGLKEISNIAHSSPVAMMATNLLKIPFSICPMTTQRVDEEGSLWFFSGKEHQHYKDITEDNKVQLLYSDDKERKYISVYGKAFIELDRELMEELWDPELNKWFDGKEDPGLVLLKVVVESAHFWDAEENKVLSLIEGGGLAPAERKEPSGQKERFRYLNH